MTDEQIKHMAQQFLAWRLPADFYPDGGVVFERGERKPGSAWWPTGTNLLTYNHALAMVQHMMAGLPDDKLARIGAATKAAKERDGVEREAMELAMLNEPGGFHDMSQAAAAALVAHAKGESDAR